MAEEERAAAAQPAFTAAAVDRLEAGLEGALAALRELRRSFPFLPPAGPQATALVEQLLEQVARCEQWAKQLAAMAAAARPAAPAPPPAPSPSPSPSDDASASGAPVPSAARVVATPSGNRRFDPFVPRAVSADVQVRPVAEMGALVAALGLTSVWADAEACEQRAGLANSAPAWQAAAAAWRQAMGAAGTGSELELFALNRVLACEAMQERAPAWKARAPVRAAGGGEGAAKGAQLTLPPAYAPELLEPQLLAVPAPQSDAVGGAAYARLLRRCRRLQPVYEDAYSGDRALLAGLMWAAAGHDGATVLERVVVTEPAIKALLLQARSLAHSPGRGAEAVEALVANWVSLPYAGSDHSVTAAIVQLRQRLVGLAKGSVVLGGAGAGDTAAVRLWRTDLVEGTPVERAQAAVLLHDWDLIYLGQSLGVAVQIAVREPQRVFVVAAGEAHAAGRRDPEVLLLRWRPAPDGAMRYDLLLPTVAAA